MKLIAEILKFILIFIILTIISQVGGFIYLIYKPFGHFIKRKIKHKPRQILTRLTVFSILFVLSGLFIIPPIARHFGRVPLPVFSKKADHLKPASILLVVLNRHYVKPELKEAILNISKEVNSKYPDTGLIYLDANFPFLDGFPLLPHRSHDDGEKLDIAFLYKSGASQKRLNKAPGILGYGYVEPPRKNEVDQPAICEAKGYWQYRLMSKLVRNRPAIQFDQTANSQLLQIISKNPSIRKIFIEPHLKTRLGFSSDNKVRFHGCKAVRHDDHIHMQL